MSDQNEHNSTIVSAVETIIRTVNAEVKVEAIEAKVEAVEAKVEAVEAKVEAVVEAKVEAVEAKVEAVEAAVSEAITTIQEETTEQILKEVEMVSQSVSADATIKSLLDQVKTKVTKTTSVAQLVLSVLTTIEDSQASTKGEDKKTTALSVLKMFAAGPDGKVGTEDDLLSKETVDSLTLLLNNDQIGTLIDSFVSVAKGITNLTKQIKQTVPLFKRLFCCGK